MKLCHQRSADRIVVGAIDNGGIYIKLGQGLACFNHILPREYTETLLVLQDKVLFFIIASWQNIVEFFFFIVYNMTFR